MRLLPAYFHALPAVSLLLPCYNICFSIWFNSVKDVLYNKRMELELLRVKGLLAENKHYVDLFQTLCNPFF